MTKKKNNKWEITEELMQENPFLCLANMLHETVDSVHEDIQGGNHLPNDMVLTVIHRLMSYLAVINGIEYTKTVMDDIIEKVNDQLEAMKEDLNEETNKEKQN